MLNLLHIYLLVSKLDISPLELKKDCFETVGKLIWIPQNNLFHVEVRLFFGADKIERSYFAQIVHFMAKVNPVIFSDIKKYIG